VVNNNHLSGNKKAPALLSAGALLFNGAWGRNRTGTTVKVAGF